MSFKNGLPFTIDVFGNMTDVTPANGTDFKADELYVLCDCDMFQFVYVHPNYEPTRGDRPWEIWLNENGKIEGKPLNLVATHLYHNPDDVIVGTVLVCPPGYVK